MILDKVKYKMVLSAVALSMCYGFDARYMVKGDYDNYLRGTKSSVIQEVKQKKTNLQVRVYGSVSDYTVQKAMRIIYNDLVDVVKDNINEQCYLAIIEDEEISDFYKNKLDFNLSEALETGKIKGREDDKAIRLYCPASKIDDLLPQMVTSLNVYFISKVG